MNEHAKIDRLRRNNAAIMCALAAIISGLSIGWLLGKCVLWVFFPQLRIFGFWGI